jgi:hypothetical protein
MEKEGPCLGQGAQCRQTTGKSGTRGVQGELLRLQAEVGKIGATVAARECNDATRTVIAKQMAHTHHVQAQYYIGLKGPTYCRQAEELRKVPTDNIC